MNRDRQCLRIGRFAARVSIWLTGMAVTGLAADWPQYRGPNHNAISPERIRTDWTGSVTNPVWIVHLTNGLTSLTIRDGRVFTQVQRTTNGENKEFCLALDAATGTELWATEVDDASYPHFGVGSTDDGPRSTPGVDGDSVYVLTSYLKLYRLEATNGAVIWSTNLLDGFGGTVIDWQNAASPVFEDGLIHLNANCGTSTLMAFRTEDGTLEWRSEDERMTHSTPVLATIHGVRQLVFATQSGLVSLNPQTGERIWKFPYPFPYIISLAPSPTVYEDTVYLSAFYTMGAVAAQIIQSNSTQVAVQRWRNSNQESHWSTPVCYQGALFGQFTPDNANAELRCIDLATGATRWAQAGFGRGGVLLADTNLIMITERGDLVLADASTNAYVERGRFQAIPNYVIGGNKCWNALALSDGQLYVRSTAYAARFDLSVSDDLAPGLTLQSRTSLNSGSIQLIIQTSDGTPIDSGRLAGIQVRATTDLGRSLADWTRLTNELVLADGVVHVEFDAAQTRQFLTVSEPE